MSSKAIVGIQIGTTSGCAVYRDGRIQFAASEERYSRVKNDPAFPDAAIRAAITACDLAPDSIEKVVLVSRQMVPDHFLIGQCTLGIDDYLREQYEYYGPRLLREQSVDYLELFSDRIDPRYVDLLEAVRKGDVPRWQVWNTWRQEKVSALFGLPSERVTIVNHEHAHAAYAYYGSPLRGEDVLVVSCDGFGDDANAAIASQAGGRLQFAHKYVNFNIGRIYRYITLLLGMKPNEHEYKVMGLAPYATEYTYRKALEVFENAYGFGTDGLIRIDPDLKDNFFYFKERLEGCRFDGIAAGLQIFSERMICALVGYWLERLGKRRVVLSGGVSLNIKANLEISGMDQVDDLFVVGSGGDESLCIAGIFAYLDELGRGAEIEPLETLYLGDAPVTAEVDVAIAGLSARNDVTVTPNATMKLVAQQLAAGQVIGRVSGRMEFGARALGNRSILADPRSAAVIRKINSKIKNRDFWMPFTPSMLPDAAARYLHNPKGMRFPYMSVACRTTSEGQASLSGALHPADLTARPQIVEQSHNEGYFELLRQFEAVTGVGALLNTSLNLHGYPIVRTAADAAHVFENSDLDGLLLGTSLVQRKHAS